MTNAPKKMSYPKSMTLARDVSRRSFLHTSAGAAGALLLSAPGWCQPDSRTKVCPKSAPLARRLAVMRLEELTSHSWDMRLTLTCLQGIVNRKQPRLYLIQDRYDELWLEWLKQRGDVDEAEWLDVGGVFGRFLPEVKSMFVTDPAIPASVNVATMLAAVHGGLVATPLTAAQYDLPMGALPDSWKTGMDLRTLNWKKNIEAYRWAFQELNESLSREAIAVLDPAATGLRDYLVEFKIPILWMSGPQDSRSLAASFDEEKAFAREILMKWPTNIPVFGWPDNGQWEERGIGEWQGVKLFSECGKFEVCSGYDGYSPTVSNLSVHSGTTAILRQASPAAVKLDRSKVYIAFTRSDGDGLNFLRHYYRKLFDDPQHGSVPIGWQVGPTAADTMPDILDYYYKHARPGDCFMNALSGVGYIHEDIFADNFPPEQQQEILRELVRLSGVYRAKIDATIMATFAEMRPKRLEQIAAIPGIKAIVANYGRTHATTPENVITSAAGKPVFRSINRGPGDLTFTPYGREEAQRFMIGEIRKWTPATRPAFLHVLLSNWLSQIGMAEKIAKGTGPDYVFVRPDQLLSLYEQSR